MAYLSLKTPAYWLEVCIDMLPLSFQVWVLTC